MGFSRKLILDGDPGSDDFIAWLIACGSPEFQILGITTVHGNVPLDATTRNALKFCDFAKVSIPVFPGADRPMGGGTTPVDEAHGADGLGGVNLPLSSRCPDTLDACSFILSEVERHYRETPKKPVTIVATGPLTNIAEALAQRPKLAGMIDEIVIMGGAFDAQDTPAGGRTGNITLYAEFNWHADPEAARIVMDSGAKITLLPLDVTQQLISTPERVENALQSLEKQGADSTGTATVRRLLMAAEHLDRKNFGVDGAFVHDACTMLYMLRSDLFTGRKAAISVHTATDEAERRGQSVMEDDSSPKAVKVLTGLRSGAGDQLYRLMIERISATLSRRSSDFPNPWSEIPSFREIIFTEWKITEDAIRSYEQVFLRCRTWSVAIFGASVIALARADAWWIAIVAIAALASLMSYELEYMSRQHIMILRGNKIQETLNSVLNESGYKDYRVRFSAMLRQGRESIISKDVRTSRMFWMYQREYLFYWIQMAILLLAMVCVMVWGPIVSAKPPL